jgi:hypothetical protein
MRVTAHVTGIDSQRTGEGMGFTVALMVFLFLFFARAIVFLAMILWGVIHEM